MARCFIGIAVVSLLLVLHGGPVQETFGSGIGDVRSGQAPIIVVGDQEFISLAENMSLHGNGSKTSPYILSGLAIEAGPNGTAIDIRDLTLSVSIQGCEIMGGPGHAGIRLVNVTDIAVCSVNVSGSDPGIDVSSGSVSISGSHISGPGTGIRISGSECSIEGNLLSDARLVLEGSTGPIIVGNWLEGGNGSILAIDCSGGLIDNNTVLNAAGNGTDLIGCKDMLLTGNLVHGCTGYAVSLTGSTSNSIVLNSFQYNRGSGDDHQAGMVQGHDGTGFNLWVTEQGKGNHWTDHTGPDVDLNGIVDEPYELDGSSSSDRFPLVASPAFISTPPYPISARPFDGRVELNWSRPVATRNIEVIGYNIYRTVQGSVRARIGTVTGPPYIDDSLENGRTYFYWIVAVTPFGEGSYPLGSMAIPDGTPPQLGISSPGNGSYHNSSTIAVRLRIQDPMDVFSLDLYIDDVGPLPLAVEENISVEGLDDGTHTIRFVFGDASMNMGSVHIEVIIDTFSPNITVQGPDGYLNGTYADVPFDVSDASPIASIEAIMDRNRTGLVRDGSIRFSGLDEGPNDFIVKATDRAGNIAAALGTILVDRTAPAIDILSPVSGARYTTNTIELDMSASDDLSGLSKVEYRIDDGKWMGWTGSGPMVLFLEEGSHTIELRATDMSGQIAFRSTGFAIELPIIIPINGSVRGRITDDIAGVRDIGIYLNGTLLGMTDGNGDFVLELPPGTYALTFEGDQRVPIRMTVTVRSNDTVDLGHLSMDRYDGPEERTPPLWMLVGLAIGTGALIVLAVALLLISRKREEIQEDVWEEE